MSTPTDDTLLARAVAEVKAKDARIEELEAIVTVLFCNAHRVDAADELTSEQLGLCADLVGGIDHE